MPGRLIPFRLPGGRPTQRRRPICPRRRRRPGSTGPASMSAPMRGCRALARPGRRRSRAVQTFQARLISSRPMTCSTVTAATSAASRAGTITSCRRASSLGSKPTCPFRDFSMRAKASLRPWPAPRTMGTPWRRSVRFAAASAMTPITGSTTRPAALPGPTISSHAPSSAPGPRLVRRPRRLRRLLRAASAGPSGPESRRR